VLWGLVSGGALLVGAAIGWFLPLSRRMSGVLMAFGAGVLVAALAFELTLEAYERGGVGATVGGLLAGGAAFALGDLGIDRRGGAHRKRSAPRTAGVPAALVLGALLDGIPESVAIGVGLVEGQSVGVAFVAAVFLSNVPEAAASAKGMRAGDHSAGFVFGLWSLVVVASALAAGFGNLALAGAPTEVVAVTLAFAAGAILTMLADTMVPDAHEEAGSVAGILTLAGFATAFLLTLL